MRARALLNGESISYLIHGQPFTLEIEATGCLFLVIACDSGRSKLDKWSFRRPRTVFKGVTNAYDPLVRVWGVGWGVRKIFEKRLQVNFMNVMEQHLRIRVPPSSPVPVPFVEEQVVEVKSPSMALKGQTPCFDQPRQPRVRALEPKILLGEGPEAIKAIEMEND